ncbi:MAG: hypothetical protein GX879_00385 [Bacteroidales bacterium]|nr:hypothetical protein [Bacteroidales bacterium]
MKKILILISLISVFSFVNAFSQNEPEEIFEVFFDTFKEDVNKAIDYLFSTNDLISPQQEGIRSLKERLEMSRKLLGNYYGHELIQLEYAGDSYRRYTYMLRYDRQPVKIIMVVYKPNKVWKLQNLNFEDKMDESFETLH